MHTPAGRTRDPPHRCRLAEKIRMARVQKERELQLREKADIAAQQAQYDKAYDEVRAVVLRRRLRHA